MDKEQLYLLDTLESKLNHIHDYYKGLSDDELDELLKIIDEIKKGAK